MYRKWRKLVRQRERERERERKKERGRKRETIKHNITLQCTQNMNIH